LLDHHGVGREVEIARGPLVAQVVERVVRLADVGDVSGDHQLGDGLRVVRLGRPDHAEMSRFFISAIPIARAIAQYAASNKPAGTWSSGGWAAGGAPGPARPLP